MQEAKRLHLKSREGMVASVVNAIDKASDVDESGREMLRSMAPLCLGTPADERHEYQVAVGEMLRQALEQAEAAVAAAIKDAAEAEARAVAAVARRKEEADQTRQRFAAQSRALEAAKEAWGEVHEGVRPAWRALVAAREERQRVDANLFEAVEKKEALEAAISSNLPPVIEGRELGPNVDALIQVCSRACVDTGLVNSFALAGRKTPEVRTPFDKIVIQQLRELANSRALELAAAAERGNPGSAERAAAVAAAEAAFAEAEARMAEAARHLRAAEVDVQIADSDVLDAEGAERDAARGKRQRAVDHVLAQWSLEQFRLGPLATFRQLHGACGSRGASEAPPLAAGASPSPAAAAVGAVATPARAA